MRNLIRLNYRSELNREDILRDLPKIHPGDILRRLECYVGRVNSEEGDVSLIFCFSNIRLYKDWRGRLRAGGGRLKSHRTGLVFPSQGKVSYNVKLGDFFFNQGRDLIVIRSSMNAETEFWIQEGEYSSWNWLLGEWLLFSQNPLLNPEAYEEQTDPSGRVEIKKILPKV